MLFNTKWVDLAQVAPSFRWTTDGQIALRAASWVPALEGVAREAQAKGQGGVAAGATALSQALQKGERQAIEKSAAALAKAGGRNTVAGTLGTEVRGHAAATPAKVFAWSNLSKALWIAVAWGAIGTVGVILIGGESGHLPRRVSGGVRARVAGPRARGQRPVHRLRRGIRDLRAAPGLLVSNTIGVPGWLRPAVHTEFFIKTGLVILGAGMLFSDLMQAGAPGMIQALLVVIVIWYRASGSRGELKVDDEFAVMLSSSVSICGVSAAIATCGAIQGDKKKLSYVTSLVLICAVPMMILMPWLVKWFGFPKLVGGAWLGGTLDTSARWSPPAK